MLKQRLLLLLSLVLLVAFGLFPPRSIAQGGVGLQIGLVLDGSDSMSDEDFALMIEGIANALRDPNVVPRDGSVEVCLVQYGFPKDKDAARGELPPTVITEKNSALLYSQIGSIVQGKGTSQIAQGIRLCTSLMTKSANYSGAERRVINIATDEVPSSLDEVTVASSEAEKAGIHALDVEALGDLNKGQLEAFSAVVFPQPVAWVPPDRMSPGFMRMVEKMTDFEQAIGDELALAQEATSGAKGKVKQDTADTEVKGGEGTLVFVGAIGILYLLFSLMGDYRARSSREEQSKPE